MKIKLVLLLSLLAVVFTSIVTSFAITDSENTTFTEEVTDINEEVEHSVFLFDVLFQPTITKHFSKKSVAKKNLYIGLSSLIENENPLLPPPQFYKNSSIYFRV